MNKYIKYMAIVAVAAVGFSAQAKAASISVNLSNGVSICVDDGKGRHAKHKAHHDIRDRHHADHCRDCRREAERRAYQSRQAHHKHHR